MDQNQELKNRIFAICSCLLLAISIFMVWLANKNISFMMDDIWYSTLLYSEEPVKNFLDILSAQIWHYNNWGGRTMAHTILQCILLLGERFADVMNTVMVLATGMIITFMSETITGFKRNWISRVAVVALIIGMIHGLNANWTLSMYWEAGAANYLYITAFILLYLWCFVREITVENMCGKKNLPGIHVWIIPLAILAGWSNENMGPVAFLFSVVSLVYCYKKCRRIKVWMVEGAVLTFAGSIACIIAPGNMVRNSQIEANNYGIIWQIYLRSYSDMNGLLNYLFAVGIIIIALLVISIGILRIKISVAEWLLIVSGVLSWGAMILSPHYPDRASYGTMILLLVAAIAIVQRIVREKPKATPGLYACGAFIWLRGMFFLAEYLGMIWGWIK